MPENNSTIFLKNILKFFRQTLADIFFLLTLQSHFKNGLLFGRNNYNKIINADVAKLVDALDLGSSAARHGGSSPSIRTNF